MTDKKVINEQQPKFDKVVPAKEALRPYHEKIGALVCMLDEMSRQIASMEKMMTALENENNQLKEQFKTK